MYAIGILYLVADKVENSNEITDRWTRFTEVALKDKMTYGCQIPIYLNMASSNPEVLITIPLGLFVK